MGLKRADRERVAPDVACVRILIANICLVGLPGAKSGEWVLVDTGTPMCEGWVRSAAARYFGWESRPAAILLTHGHFDHVGAVADLADEWGVPIYAHEKELPFLTGKESYPPADPAVGGGLMALLSPLYPRRPIDLADRVQALPADGTVPGLPDWRWLHTSGHTPGHVSFFRERDRVLIAGDAITTVKQESFWAVLTQRQALHGPPSYFTPDWVEAKRSVERLAALNPAVAATGHGIPMQGERLARELSALAREFDRRAVPTRGRNIKRAVVEQPERETEKGPTKVW